jgi:transposase
MEEPKRLDMTEAELNAFFDRLEKDELTDSDRKNIKDIMAAFLWMAQKLEDKELSIKRLQRLFGVKTEKNPFGDKDKDKDDKGHGGATGGSSPGKNANPEPKPKGKNGADDYPGAEKIFCPHESLKAGDTCPLCDNGTLFQFGSGTVLRLTGQSPIKATIYQPEQLRCSGCQALFTAKLPSDIGMERADASAKATIAMFRYGAGMPFYRLEKLSEMFLVPLPDSTQWDLVEEVTEVVYPAFNALMGLAAQGSLFHADDTGNRVVWLKKQLIAEGAERTGIFSTGILSQVDGREIALFFTGNKHAGENMTALLKRRKPGHAPPNLMCDALSRNKPKGIDVVYGNCMDHARRDFIDLIPKYESECRHFIERLGRIYFYDREAKQLKFTDEARLAHHKEKSLPIMEELKAWCEQKFAQKEVEPNGPLGGALQYFLNHFTELTQFCKALGMPLSNAAVERLIKTAVLHRKNSLFYMSIMGALVGDVMMSLIQTAKRAGVNVLDYLTKLQQHAADVKKTPDAWFPWNYLDRVALLQPAR